MLLILVISASLVHYATSIRVGDECTSHVYCNYESPESMDHTKCVDGQCLCINSYYGEIGASKCVQAAIGSECGGKLDKEHFCKTASANAVCAGVPETCQCRTGYYRTHNVGGESICLPIIVGSPCNVSDSGDAFCQSGVNDSFCDPTLHECLCHTGHVSVHIGDDRLCGTEVSHDLCAACSLTGGHCYDLESDGTPSGCSCPESRGSSGANEKETLAVGCDIGLAQIGDFCLEDGSIRCVQEHSSCVHGGDLNTDRICKCDTGYSPVMSKEYEYIHSCYKSLSQHTDPNCLHCITREGVCYDIDEDDLRDGCLCTSSRTTTDMHDPDKACDETHVLIGCQSESMYVCYNPHNTTEFPNMAYKLNHGLSLIYVDKRLGQDPCTFSKPLAGEKTWCLALSLDHDQTSACNTQIYYPDDKTVSYENWAILQIDAASRSSADMYFHAFCQFDTSVNTVSKMGAEVVSFGTFSSEGEAIHPDLVMTIFDEFNRDATEMGLALGQPAMVEITMPDGKGVYTAIRPEVCIASNTPSLSHPDTQSVLLVYNGCPVESSVYMNHHNGFHHDPVDLKISRSGFFTMFQFENSNFVFFHCAVKVCRRDTNCAPPNCTSVARRKRAIDPVVASRFVRRARQGLARLENLESGPVRVISEEVEEKSGIPRFHPKHPKHEQNDNDVIAIDGPTLIGIVGGVLVLTILIGGAYVYKSTKSRATMHTAKISNMQQQQQWQPGQIIFTRP